MIKDDTPVVVESVGAWVEAAAAYVVVTVVGGRRRVLIWDC